MTTATPVAIVGMAVLLPGAPDLDLSTYWQNLVAGVDAITEVPADRWDPRVSTNRAKRTQQTGFLAGVAGLWTSWPRSRSPSLGLCRRRWPTPSPTS
ncbi:beta-ketoacyl synthase N-terminal-like domain-containing protein [Fodinicola feengrottensis]|uniref:beta-ketoacyl synthase N-terminal-like domain-containing protein n=1 Tax=Fodinicola feengrottensis TaxID=435914 RepID=UPI0024412F20|nr:beta-ketoacyl synthase N-terminal-like domain-containing protein [Fodinicola feengrottensis]